MSELFHHGIKGQKWGVRRFQNKDGTLTAAGSKRYSIDNGELKSRIKKSFDAKNFREKNTADDEVFDYLKNSMSNRHYKKISAARDEYLKASRLVDTSNDSNYEERYARFDKADKKLTAECNKFIDDMLDSELGQMSCKDISSKSLSNAPVEKYIKDLMSWQVRW